MQFKFQSDSINTISNIRRPFFGCHLNSNLILLIPKNWKARKALSEDLNSNLILLIRYSCLSFPRCLHKFKFQSDSINTDRHADFNGRILQFKFQSDSINTPCSKTPLKPQVTTLISVDLRNKHLYALTS